MSDKDQGHDSGPKKWKYFVDDTPYESSASGLSGREIKARIAGLDPSYALYQEIRKPGQSDRLITDDTTVDLSEAGAEKFYTVPPATFGDE